VVPGVGQAGVAPDILIGRDRPGWLSTHPLPRGLEGSRGACLPAVIRSAAYRLGVPMHSTSAFLSILDSREKAAVIWLAAIVGYGTLKARRDIGSPVVLLLRTIFHWKMLLLFGAAAGYCVAVVAVARWAGLWQPTAAKETVYWFFTGGIVLVGGAVSRAKPSDPDFYRDVLRQAVRATIVIEFLVNLYVFPFFVELILMPIMLLLVVAQLIATNDPALASLRRPIEVVLIATGVFLLVHVTVAATGDPTGLVSRENAETLLIAPAFTVAFLPFLGAWAWVSRREQENLRRRFRAEYDGAV
jgi:hypothetical protein